jgi:hypothetical protein
MKGKSAVQASDLFVSIIVIATAGIDDAIASYPGLGSRDNEVLR